MSYNTRLLRKAADSTLDALETLSFTEGFEAATIGLEELSDIEASGGEIDRAEILRWAARELRGDNA
jgi:hypothetical protein